MQTHTFRRFLNGWLSVFHQFEKFLNVSPHHTIFSNTKSTVKQCNIFIRAALVRFLQPLHMCQVVCYVCETYTIGSRIGGQAISMKYGNKIEIRYVETSLVILLSIAWRWERREEKLEKISLQKKPTKTKWKNRKLNGKCRTQDFTSSDRTSMFILFSKLLSKDTFAYSWNALTVCFLLLFLFCI